MPSKAPTPCLRCGSLGRCIHRTTPDRRNTRAWQQTSTRIRQDWLRLHGPWCPGYGVEPHHVDPADLTVDHIIPTRHGGTDHPDNLTVPLPSMQRPQGRSLTGTKKGPPSTAGDAPDGTSRRDP